MAADLPAAVAHLEKYPAATLDSGTLRALRGDCATWLLRHPALLSPGGAERVELWEVFGDDIRAAQAVLGTLTDELKSRGAI